MANQSLIQIHPKLEASAACPKCQSESVKSRDYLFQGIHVLVDCTCQQCTTRFFHTLPIAHDAITPISISHDGKHVRYDASAKVWLAQPLIDGLLHESSRLAVEIVKRTRKALTDKIIVLNCLDDCFGHSYAKLLNAQQLLHDYPDHSLILLITPNFEWLVPDGVAELWIVPASMRKMKNYITTLQSFVKTAFNNASQVYLSTAKVFHRLEEINSELFLRTKRFDLSLFDSVPYTITFVLREDRYWHSNKLDNVINLALIKFKIKKNFNSYFVWRQDRLVKKAVRLIINAYPHLKVNITGIGKPGQSDTGVTDLRTDKITSEIERQWCVVYSKSHVVVGVHGSNMLIPTSLAAGFIDILPRHKIPHMGEDTVLHYAGRHAMLLGRHVDVYATPALVAEHAINMLGFGRMAKLMNGQ
jgi:hypothetical protein